MLKRIAPSRYCTKYKVMSRWTPENNQKHVLFTTGTVSVDSPEAQKVQRVEVQRWGKKKPQGRL